MTKATKTKARPVRKPRTFAKKIMNAMREVREAIESGEPLEKRLTRRNADLLVIAFRYRPEAIRALRKSLGLSQALFAKFLGVSPQAVRGWEQGTFRPGGMALRFFEEIDRDLPYWRKRVAEVAQKNTK